MKKKPQKKPTPRARHGKRGQNIARNIPPAPAAKVWTRHVIGWVDPTFFAKVPVGSLTVHGAPRQVGGKAIDIPVIVMENSQGFSIQPKGVTR